MSQQTYLILLPHPSTPKGREDQGKDVKLVHNVMQTLGIKPANGNGVITFKDKKNVTTLEVAQVLEATIVIFDANRYETTEFYSLSPYLYYFLGVRHAMGNQTIIVTETDHHLPAVFQQHHTLIYDRSDWEHIEEFRQNLSTITKKIIDREDEDRPDNPIQLHISQTISKSQQENFDKVTAQQQATEEKLAELQKRLDKYVAELNRQQQRIDQRPSTARQPIQFRPVNKKE